IGQLPPEVVQPGEVAALVVGRLRQLAEQPQQPAAPPQLVDGLPEGGQVARGFLVAERLRPAGRELEAGPRLLRPTGLPARGRQAVKGEVQFDDREVAAVVAQHLVGAQPRRVERPHPVVVGIARGADPNFHAVVLSPWSLVLSKEPTGGLLWTKDQGLRTTLS